MVQYTLLLKPYKPLLPFECEKVYPKRWIRTRNWSGRDCSSKSSESSFLPSDLPPTIETARPFFSSIVPKIWSWVVFVAAAVDRTRMNTLSLASSSKNEKSFSFDAPTSRLFFSRSMHQNQCCSSCQLKLGRKNLLFSRLPVCQLLGGEFIRA